MLPAHRFVPPILPLTGVRPGFANSEPLLSVSSLESGNFFTLTKPLLRQLGLGAHSRVRLVVPRKVGGTWFLDIAPRGEEGNRLPDRGSALFRLPPIGRDRFLLAPLIKERAKGRDITASQNRFATRLYFRLGQEVEPGYYQLVQVGAGL
jgi:hypothetical protein